MDVGWAIIRLSLFGAFAWLLFWSDRYLTGCIHARNGAFFCPETDGQTLARTDSFHIAAFLLVPPLTGLIVAGWTWYSLRE